MNYITTAQKDLTANTLKYIAIIAMFFDHLFAVFVSQETLAGILLRVPGRVVAPIMCYLIAEGFHYTSNVKKYIMRLVVFAAVSHFPYILYFGYSWWQATSVFWGLALGLIALAAAKNDNFPIYIKVLVIGLCCLLAVPADWNYVAVLWILFFGLFRGQVDKQMISFAVIGTALHIIPAIVHMGWGHANQMGIFLAIPLLLMYKGRRGKKSKFLKWGFYVFYPAHLLILYFVYKLFI